MEGVSTTRKIRIDIGSLTSVRVATDVKSIYDIGYYKTDVFQLYRHRLLVKPMSLVRL